MAAPIRRVVARAGADGATVVDDAPATAVMELPAVPGTALTDLWRSDVVPVPAPDGTDPTAADFALMPAVARSASSTWRRPVTPSRCGTRPTPSTASTSPR
ncbi:MAG: hypothetical protein R2699_15730 [Acidimicrobiales bacterium]